MMYVLLIGGVVILLLLGGMRIQQAEVKSAKADLKICMDANRSLADSIADVDGRCKAAKTICEAQQKKDKQKQKAAKDELDKLKVTNQKTIEQLKAQAHDASVTGEDCALTYSILDDLAAHRLQPTSRP